MRRFFSDRIKTFVVYFGILWFVVDRRQIDKSVVIWRSKRSLGFNKLKYISREDDVC